VLTLRWIMREPTPDDPTDGPRLDVTTTVSKAAPALAASEKPVCAVENGNIVGIVDRNAVLTAIAGERDD
jgi:glycine betaine/proline transport system ATP-binding protein